MIYTFEQLKDDVRKEAEALWVHATAEERGRLDLERLDGNHVTRCIYGQMTGHCDSERATFLIKKCAPLFYEAQSEGLSVIVNENFDYFRWSPIEHYIRIKEAKNANLIAYLRGETETLDL